ncbi:MAG: CoB--CoM heterodisulfide reductase iron-sulfur subunit B family protein [Deltaproteobacteria bacterium]|nr:CoB--CoM heterodisulfide reductase iron-sulfur subunit B family protein [Deltaproteobacteria bacterium]MCL5891974.1 CoB--CoM heterodisulfide reductase iron-sulfur subunit B family protein [Deltaproteobacteria bacterium]
MKLAYYPGCSLKGTSFEYEVSLLKILEALNIEIKEIPDWNCCGASAAHSINHNLSIALPARNLAIAEGEGYESVLAPCAACSNRLKTAHHELKSDDILKKKITDSMEMPYKGDMEINNMLEFLIKIVGKDKIKSMVKKPLSGLKVASYYGCLLVRPPKIMQFDDPENPVSMDELVGLTGAETVDYSYKTECCGAINSLSKPDVVMALTGNVLYDIKKHGADLVVVACPLCHSNLDVRQREIERKYSEKIGLPVLFITELLGLSFGIAPKDLAIEGHMVAADRVLRKIEGLKN